MFSYFPRLPDPAFKDFEEKERCSSRSVVRLMVANTRTRPSSCERVDGLHNKFSSNPPALALREGCLDSSFLLHTSPFPPLFSAMDQNVLVGHLFPLSAVYFPSTTADTGL